MKSIFVAMDPKEARDRGVRLGTMAAERCYSSLEYAQQCNPKHQIVEFGIEDDIYDKTAKSAYQQVAPSYVVSEYVGKPSYNLILCRNLDGSLVKTAHKSWRKGSNESYGTMPRLATDHLAHLYGTCGFIIKTAGDMVAELTSIAAEMTLPDFARATMLGKGAQIRDQVYRKITGQSILQEDEYEPFDPIQAAETFTKISETIEFLSRECQELHTTWKKSYVEESESKLNLARQAIASSADFLRSGDITRAALTATSACEMIEKVAGKEGMLCSLYMDLGSRFEDLDGVTLAKRKILNDLEKRERSEAEAAYIRSRTGGSDMGGGFNRIDGVY